MWSASETTRQRCPCRNRCPPRSRCASLGSSLACVDGKELTSAERGTTARATSRTSSRGASVRSSPATRLTPRGCAAHPRCATTGRRTARRSTWGSCTPSRSRRTTGQVRLLSPLARLGKGRCAGDETLTGPSPRRLTREAATRLTEGLLGFYMRCWRSCCTVPSAPARSSATAERPLTLGGSETTRRSALCRAGRMAHSEALPSARSSARSLARLRSCQSRRGSPCPCPACPA